MGNRVPKDYFDLEAGSWHRLALFGTVWLGSNVETLTLK